MDAKAKSRKSIPTHDEMHSFLALHYKHERFEGRNTRSWGHDYSHVVAESHLDYLRRFGVGFISRHEAACGRAVKYSTSLSIIDDGA